jgi:hypothetical protein
MPEFADHGILL